MVIHDNLNRNSRTTKSRARIKIRGKKKKSLFSEQFKVGTFFLTSVAAGLYLGLTINSHLDKMVEKYLNTSNSYKQTAIEESYTEKQSSKLENIVISNYAEDNVSEDYSYQVEESHIKENVDQGKVYSASAQSLDEKIVEDNQNTESELISRIKQTKFANEISKMYADLITQYPLLYSTAYEISKEYNFDPALIMGLITIEGGIQLKYLMGETENGTEIKIVNPLSKDIKGVCQISKDTWKTYGKDYSWEQMDNYEPNIIVGIRTLKAYLNLFDNELSDALVAYNLGPGKVLNVKKKYANGEKGKVASILKRWVNQGFKEYKEPAYYPGRVLKMAFYFEDVLEKAGLYDGNIANFKISEDYIKALPAKSNDGLVLGSYLNNNFD